MRPPTSLIPHVLLIDDDPLILSMLSELLCRQRLTVALATERAAALVLAVKCPPNLIVMDYSMPGSTPPDVFLQKLHAAGICAEVILCTASENAPELAHRLGLRWLLEKPFRCNEFLATISAASDVIAAHTARIEQSS